MKVKEYGLRVSACCRVILLRNRMLKTGVGLDLPRQDMSSLNFTCRNRCITAQIASIRASAAKIPGNSCCCPSQVRVDVYLV